VLLFEINISNDDNFLMIVQKFYDSINNYQNNLIYSILLCCISISQQSYPSLLKPTLKTINSILEQICISSSGVKPTDQSCKTSPQYISKHQSDLFTMELLKTLTKYSKSISLTCLNMINDNLFKQA